MKQKKNQWKEIEHLVIDYRINYLQKSHFNKLSQLFIDLDDFFRNLFKEKRMKKQEK